MISWIAIARRTLDRDPERARAVIESIETTGRQALTEAAREVADTADAARVTVVSDGPVIGRFDQRRRWRADSRSRV